MSVAHLHLILTHFPPVLSLGAIAAVAAFLLPGRRRDAIAMTLALLITTGATMPIVFFTGEQTADMLGKVEGVQQDAIAPHQEAAKIALAVSLLAAAVAGATGIVMRRRGDLSPVLRVLLMTMAIASAMAIGWAAMRGGAIHHPEAFHSVADVTEEPPAPFTS